MRSVKVQYKATKIKGAVRLHGNEDPALGMVREFEEQPARTRHGSIFWETVKCAEQFGLELDLDHVQKIRTDVRKVKSRSYRMRLEINDGKGV